MIPSAPVLFQGLVDYLSTLPPAQNKYDAAAEYITNYAVVLSLPQSTAEKVSVYILLVLFSLVLIFGTVLIVCRKAWRPSSYFSMHRGLIRPNASNLLVLFSNIFSAVAISEMAVELTAPTDALGPDPTAWYALSGIRYVPVYLCGLSYAWAVAASCVTLQAQQADLTSTRQPNRFAPRSEWRWRATAWSINTAMILTTVATVAVIIPLFTLSGVNGGPFRRGLLATVEMLHTAAPTYNPATFYSALLLPMLRPLQLVLPNGNTALNDFYAGFATWVALVIWLFAFSTPFTVVQLRLLRKARNVRTGLKGAAVGGPKVSADTQSRRSAYQRHKRSVLSRMENMSEFSMLIVITLLIWIIIAIHVALAIRICINVKNLHTVALDRILSRLVGELPYCLVALAICSIQLLLWLRSEGYMHDATQTVHRQSLAAPMELPRSPVAIQFAGDDQLRSDDAMLEKGPDHGAEFANEVMVETTTDTKVEEDV